MSRDLTTSNVKFHFHIRAQREESELWHPEKSAASDVISRRDHRNFSVYRVKRLVFTIFQGRHYVNVTGVKNFELISEAVNTFNLFFREKVLLSDITIDNSTSSGSLGKRVNLVATRCFLDSEKNSTGYRLSLRPHYFPGGVLRKKGHNTVIIFATGKYIIVGAKSPETVFVTQHLLHTIIQASHHEQLQP